MVSLKQFKHFWLCYFLQVCDVNHHCHHMNKLISFSSLHPSRPFALEAMTLKLGCHSVFFVGILLFSLFPQWLLSFLTSSRL